MVEAARLLANEGTPRGFLPSKEKPTLLPIEETATPYYVRFKVTDRPGVIAEIATVLAEAGVGISGTHSPLDPENPDAEFVDMVFFLHETPFGYLRETLAKVETLESVQERPVVFRIERL